MTAAGSFWVNTEELVSEKFMMNGIIAADVGAATSLARFYSDHLGSDGLDFEPAHHGSMMLPMKLRGRVRRGRIVNSPRPIKASISLEGSPRGIGIFLRFVSVVS